MVDNPYIKKLVRDDISALSAYHVPDPAGCIKLDAMENPYQLPAELKEAWLARLHSAELNRYPDPSAKQLKQQLRKAMKVPANAELLLGNGSDEIIQMIIMALAKPGAVVMAPEPGFVMYKMISLFCNVNFVGVPLTEDFSLDMPAMRKAIAKYHPAVIFIAWPNNPTGNLFSEEDILDLIASTSGLVVIDEAYSSFSGCSFLRRVNDFDNVVVMRTVSKSGLAGLRLGYLVASPAWCAEFDKLRLPYNINILTQVSAEFVLEHTEVLAEQATRICVAREDLLKTLNTMPGVAAFPSAANFILFRVKGADTVFAGLKEKGVLIKNLNPAGGVLRDCLRVTVGTGDENAAFIAALKASM
jgi:histidinol-phosphate aminotransferase